MGHFEQYGVERNGGPGERHESTTSMSIIDSPCPNFLRSRLSASTSLVNILHSCALSCITGYRVLTSSLIPSSMLPVVAAPTVTRPAVVPSPEKMARGSW